MEHPSLRNLTSSNFGKPPKTQNKLLQQLGEPHINSFNFLIDEGLDLIVNNVNPVEFQVNNDRLKFSINELSFSYPEVPFNTIGVKDRTIYPAECRQGGSTYKGHLTGRIAWSLNGVEQTEFVKDFGQLPVMVKSKRCNLSNMNPKQLVAHGEHEQEWGGYFVVKGNEKIVRMLLMTRRNYPITIRRSGWKGRGTLFSDSGILIRSVTYDQTTTNNVLHFLTDGTCKLMFSHRKILYYVPLCLILKSLCDYCDFYIFQHLTQGKKDDLYYIDCIQNMLRAVHKENLHNQDDCKAYLGKMFRIRLLQDCPEWYTDVQMADFMIKNCILIHLDKPEDKFNMLVFMTQKLYAFIQNKCQVEGADGVMTQEILLGGHLYLQLLKEKLQSWLTMLKIYMIRQSKTTTFTINQKEVMKAAKFAGGIEKAFENFLATGNIHSVTGLGLMQDKGLTIMAENINHMRYMSHFRAVHRGSFFQEMRTTEARQLLPDAWGFICPVHTPDGAPCGLLNHLTMNCIVTNVPTKEKVENIPFVLVKLGMVPLKNVPTSNLNMKLMYMVQLDGRIIGYIDNNAVNEVINKLRLLKIENQEIPNTLEIVLVPNEEYSMQYPGVFLFSGPARMMRPVINLTANKIEFVGTFEQVYLDVATTTEEIYKDVTTHMELSKTSFLSNLAMLIPMPDCNQSPRNMYQCQMGKQTMGTPSHIYDLQSENKLYRLQTPATPLFRPVHYDNIMLDDFPMGTNAIVAVISYTGYDMEDAMIINKSSEERGLAHGSIYKTEFIELDDPAWYFEREPQNQQLSDYLDTDGLPIIGRQIHIDEPFYCFYNTDESKYIVKKFKGKEDAFINGVKLVSSLESSKKGRIACVTFRIPRNPTVGDKFASRAGQKGICSQKWPTEDLPFTETGLVPDIVFNPHGFPSRMTIAMMIEIMAGKSAAVHGVVHDATPFKFNENDTAIDYFGKLLEQGGYNYYGTETMYSGIDGREMTAQIFFGIVHYQRLRHMVSDKWQVRSTGPTDILTKQPLKGRKRGGGVRFGEMERDSLISHGASFLLQDRLLHCSDKTTALICTTCRTLLGPVTLVTRKGDKPNATETKDWCQLCENADNVAQIQIPYIFKFFVTQLASCNINVQIQCEHV